MNSQIWIFSQTWTHNNSLSKFIHKVNVAKVSFLTFASSNRGQTCQGCSSRCTPSSYHQVPRWARTRAYLRFLDLVPERDFLFLRQPPRRSSVWVFHRQRPPVAQPLTLFRCWRNRTFIGVSPTTWSTTEVSFSPNVFPAFSRLCAFMCACHLRGIYATPPKHGRRRERRG